MAPHRGDEERVLCRRAELTGQIVAAPHRRAGNIERSADALRVSHHPNHARTKLASNAGLATDRTKAQAVAQP
jgi:hypothetical protein